MSKAGTRIRYDKLVPADSFIGQYLEYMNVQETPHSYDFWSAAWALSVAVGRNTVVNRPRAPVHLNLYCLLVAESGTTRKSTAVNGAVSLIRPLTTGLPRLIESKITPEKLETILHDQSKQLGRCSVAIAISELVTFLGREKYTESMPTMLTDLYDSPEIRTGGGTLSKGDTVLKNVYVSFLSASTPAWLLRAVNPDVIEGGFTSRVLFIVETKPKRLQSWPENANADLRQLLEKNLSDVRDRSASVSTLEVNPSARKTFDKWYKSRYIARDTFRASFQSREDGHVLRLAGLLSINDGTWVIQHSHVVAAIKVVTQVREDGASIFEGTGSHSRIVLGVDKIRDKLLAAGMSGITQGDLTKACQSLINATHIKAALDIMLELQMVQKFENIQVSRGRPTTLWRATSALTQSKALDKIIEAHNPGG